MTEKPNRIAIAGGVLSLATILGSCSNVGPGFAHHPVDCAVGFPWADCLEGTAGYNNGGGSETRAEAAKAQNAAISATREAIDAQCQSDLQSPDLDPIRSKVELSRAAPDQIPPFAITSNNNYPTVAEHEAVAKWATIRDGCLRRTNAAAAVPPTATPLQAAFMQQDKSFGNEIVGHVSTLIVDLYQGKLTYGEFAQKRYEYGRDGSAAQRQFRAAALLADHDRQVEEQRLAQQRFQNALSAWSSFEQSVSVRPVHCNSIAVGSMVSTNCF